MTATKSPWASKRVWGAIFFLLSTLGLSRYGIVYDDAANTLTLHLDTITERMLAGTGVFGAVLHFVGAFVAKHKIGW